MTSSHLCLHSLGHFQVKDSDASAVLVNFHVMVQTEADAKAAAELFLDDINNNKLTQALRAKGSEFSQVCTCGACTAY